ncbi:response regulator [Paenibacillus psychroresistens]|uniref:Response regulator n=1 Tax=Paenibacillus psychroresistens TaxID=1778678 RepID=A0A6B8RFL6_9BACL|nr:response regulator [Paenibacillus psychroresistens]QGQ94323.1 response regulator [Paenibacillus psychroresistens]
MRIMIVDDEEIILQRLVHLREWGDIGCEIVGEASNGADALSAISKCKPDLIISDIRMPDMDGIELAERVRRKYPLIRVIFLTAYSDFNYAQQAVKLGVVDFITKPVNVNELMDAVELIKPHKDDEEHEKSSFQEKTIQLMLSSESNPQEQKNWLIKHDLMNRNVIVLSIEVDNIDLLYSMGKSFSPLNLRNTVNYTLNFYPYKYWNYQDRRGLFLVLFQSGDDCIGMYDDGMKIGRDLLALCKKTFEFTVSIGISSILQSVLELSQGWKEVRKCLEYRMLLGKGSIISMDSINSLDKYEWTGNDPDLLEFQGILRRTESESVAPFMRLVYKEILSRGLNKTYIEKNVLALIDQAEKVTEDYSLQFTKEYFMFIRKKALSYDVLTDLMRFLEQEFISIASAIQDNQNKLVHGSIKKVKEYIENNYRSEITLYSLSQKLYMSHEYVSRLIKKETGHNFRELLTRKRIDAAKKLLLEDRLKSYEIAHEIGFENPAHFSLLFKKMVGVSPIEYRETVNRDK